MSRWLSGVALLALALATAWVARELAAPQVAPAPAPQEIDFFMTDFTTVAMSAEGVRERELRAERLVHYADSGTHELTAPRLCVALDRPNPWCAVAERGWVSADQETVRLLGAVHLWEQDAAGSNRIDVYTRDVTVLTGAQQASTEAPARIVGRWGEAAGVGMVARWRERQIQLLSGVTTRYDTQVR
jgi:lipopolysaccharide export system protein LptC